MTRLTLLFAGLLGAATWAQALPPPPPTPAPEVEEKVVVPGSEFGQAQLGGVGLDRVRSGFISPRSLAVTLRGGFYRVSALSVPAAIDEYRTTMVSAAYSPLPMLEFSTLLRSTTLEQPASPLGNYWLVNDFFFKVKAGTTFAKGALALAGEAFLRLPPPLFRADPVWQGWSPGLGALLSYDLRPATGVPVLFHVNTNIFFDNSVDFDDSAKDLTRRSALEIVTFNQWRSGAGIEARFAAGPVGIRPFVEYTVDVPLGATGTPPMRLNPGVRVMPWKGLYLDGLVEIGLTKPTQPGLIPLAPWMVQFALGWHANVDPGVQVAKGEVVEKVVEKTKLVEQKPTTGRVQGLITDASTKKPLGDSVIQVAGRNRILTEADGRFVIPEVEPGPVKIVATHPGYEPREQSGFVDKGGLLTLDVALPTLPPEPPKPMAVKGSVLNEQEKPMVATIAVPTGGVAMKSNANGEFTLSMPSGEHALEVSAPGYLAQAKRVTGAPGDSVVVDFVLKPVPKQSLVVLKKDKIEIKKQVHFATGRDVILPDSAPLLDEVAATLLGHANLKVIRIEGHTDDQGADDTNLDLSQRRAKAVMRAILERGVDASRLKAVGYGETKPVADNKKPAGRALNRRVEFMIEAQE